MKTVILILFTLAFTSAFSQKITVYKSFGGLHYETDSTIYSPREVLELMKRNPVAYEEFKRARLNSGVSAALGSVGGFMIGFPIGASIAGGTPEWNLAIGGAALVLASIPFYQWHKHRAVNAVDIYNEGLSARIKTRFYFTGTGAKLVIKF